MTTYKIGKKAYKATKDLILTDLPVFTTPKEAFDYIQDELFDYDFSVYFVTPVEVN